MNEESSQRSNLTTAESLPIIFGSFSVEECQERRHSMPLQFVEMPAKNQETKTLSPPNSPHLEVSQPKTTSWAELAKMKRPNVTEKLTDQKRDKPEEEVASPIFQETERNTLVHIISTFTTADNHNAPKIRPRGLMNQENTCFLHVVLQPLIFCPPFVQLIRRFDAEIVKRSGYTLPLLQAMIRFVREFEPIDRSETIKAMRKKQNAFFPDYLYKALHEIKSITRGQQEDAQEFLGAILDILHEEFMMILRDDAWRKGLESKSNYVSSSYEDKRHDQEAEWLEIGPKKKVSIMREVRLNFFFFFY
jgi:ubiquitin carboxyl-terminal hydrolase 10